MGNMGGMLYLLVIVAVFYFFMIRPQQQMAKKRAEMLTQLKNGDKVVTIGGICGTISRITDDKIYVEIAEGLVIEMLRNSISSVETETDLVNPFEDDDDFDEDDDDIYYDEEDIVDIDVEDKDKN